MLACEKRVSEHTQPPRETVSGLNVIHCRLGPSKVISGNFCRQETKGTLPSTRLIRMPRKGVDDDDTWDHSVHWGGCPMSKLLGKLVYCIGEGGLI